MKENIEMPKINSPAYELLSDVWYHSNNASIFSWERLNRSMRTAIELAIDCGMTFYNDDFTKISNDLRMRYWAHGEDVYTQAVKSNNISACKAIEIWLKRKPFIAKFPISLGTTGIGRTACRKEGRIAVGTQFEWKGKQVTTTSFSKDGDSFLACSYKVTTQPYERKIEKRYRITRKGLNLILSAQ